MGKKISGKGTKEIGAMEGVMKKMGADVTWEAERKGDNIGEYGSLRRYMTSMIFLKDIGQHYHSI